MENWIEVKGRVVQGHRVAARPSAEYPYGTLVKQKPYFKARGLDLDAFFTGTINISISPLRLELVQPEFSFPDVEWTDLHPPEHFSFSRCRVRFLGREFAGFVYYPHPETKIRHHQDSGVIEVISEFIEGISYGSPIELLLNPGEIRLTVDRA